MELLGVPNTATIKNFSESIVALFLFTYTITYTGAHLPAHLYQLYAAYCAGTQ